MDSSDDSMVPTGDSDIEGFPPGACRWVVVRVDATLLRLRVARFGPTLRPARSPSAHENVPLLLIPGHTARIEGFSDLAPALARTREVIVVDLPGCGESDRPDRRYTLRFYEDVLVALLDELGVPAAIPVGGSLGGNLVLRLGHRVPDRFPELVVWAPGSAWPARRWLSTLTRVIGSRLTFWPSVWIQSRFWYERSFPGRDQALADTFAYYRACWSPGFIRMYWGLAADQVGHSLFALAPSITQPTLLMWGDRDNGAGMGRGVARLRSLLPDVRFHVFEGARHSIETEIPDALANTIRSFVDRSQEQG